jgi:hypothetical protein
MSLIASCITTLQHTKQNFDKTFEMLASLDVDTMDAEALLKAVETGKKTQEIIREVQMKSAKFTMNGAEKIAFKNRLIWIGISLDLVDEQLEDAETKIMQYPFTLQIQRLTSLIVRVSNLAKNKQVSK